MVFRAGREDQPVIVLSGTGAGLDDLRRWIDADYLVEQYRRVGLAAEDRADRFGDVGRRQRRGRDLIQ